MTAEQLETLVKQASEAYYSGQPIMSDSKFDQYVMWLKATKPDSEVLRKTGFGYSPNGVKGNKIPHVHGCFSDRNRSDLFSYFMAMS